MTINAPKYMARKVFDSFHANVHFCDPRKRQKTFGFLTFSRGTEMTGNGLLNLSPDFQNCENNKNIKFSQCHFVIFPRML